MKRNERCLFSISSLDFKANLLFHRELTKGGTNVIESQSLKAAVGLPNR